MNEILFLDDKHKARYYELIQAYSFKGEIDCYRSSLAYLIALTDETYRNRSRLYNEQERVIIPEGLNAAFQTGTTTKLTLLAFNLFTNSLMFCPEEMTNYCTPDNIFACDLAIYFFQAIKIRYPEYF